jgi:hypothetical protein
LSTRQGEGAPSDDYTYRVFLGQKPQVITNDVDSFPKVKELNSGLPVNKDKF